MRTTTRVAFCLFWLVAIVGLYWAGRATAGALQAAYHPGPNSRTGTIAVAALAEAEITGMARVSDPVADMGPRGFDSSPTELLARATLAELKARLDEEQRAPESPKKASITTAIYRRWGELAPEDALAQVQSLSILQRDARENEILRGWVGIDPDAAWQWALAHVSALERGPFPFGGVRASLLVSELLELERPDVAVRLINGTANATVQASAANSLQALYLKYDLSAAAEVAFQLKDGAAKSNSIARIMRVLAEEAPEDAVVFAARVPDPAGRKQMFAAVFLPWSQAGNEEGRNFNPVADWISNQSVGEVRDSALAAYIPMLVRSAPDQVARLLETFSQRETRQATINDVVNGMASAVAPGYPERTISWIVGVPDNPDRLQHLKTAVALWGAKSPAEAKDYVTNQPAFTGEERAALLELLRTP